MDWNDWQNILRWRAIEEGDADGALLHEDRRREATARTRAGLTTEQVRGESLSSREAAFLLRRARWLENEVVGCNGPLVRLLERLTVVRGRPSWTMLGWIFSAILGYALSGLGQEAEFNLLALPLAGILSWNALVMALALFVEFRQERCNNFLQWLALMLAPPLTSDRSLDTDPPTGMTVDQRFIQLAHKSAFERWQKRFRAWLHVAAALVALGSITGLYTRGWSKEYKAVWESTLLSEAGAQQFLGMLFTPAARLTNLELPLNQLPAMHRTSGAALQPSPALPWIHLYAATLLLLVVLPRLMLAGFTVWRAHHTLTRRMRSLGWRSYLTRTLKAVEGGQEIITVLVHATDATPSHLEVWSRGVRERFGQLTQPEFTTIRLGDEDDFAAAWRPVHPRAVVVFNLATTPEAEVQRRLMLDIKQRLQTTLHAAELTVLLDATSIGGRWSPEKLAGREKLWTDLLQGTGAEIIVAARRGGT